MLGWMILISMQCWSGGFGGAIALILVLMQCWSADTPHYNGTLTFIGTDCITLKKRDIYVIDDTNDFTLARGIATLQSDVVEENLTYFRLLFFIKLFYRFCAAGSNPYSTMKDVI
eukprot:Gb_23176 [translate_table: standard]